MKYKHRHKPKWPILSPGDAIGSGDSTITYDAYTPTTFPQHLFTTLKSEVAWRNMSHRTGEVPRLVCCQGTYNPDRSFPIYRHPADEAPPLLPWSPTVDDVRKRVETLVGHELNHCLVQLYRSGQDFISEHSDKTLDIVQGSKIVNVSFGALRTMRLRTKRSAVRAQGETAEVSNDDSPRRTQLIPLPHGSAFILGLQTNATWLHGIHADKRPDFERSEEELAFDGERISLTFRQIGTFLSSDGVKIWGQGARGKSIEEARAVVHGGDEAERLVIAFGRENHGSTLDWAGVYGDGFNVVNFTVVDGEKTDANG